MRRRANSWRWRCARPGWPDGPEDRNRARPEDLRDVPVFGRNLKDIEQPPHVEVPRPLRLLFPPRTQGRGEVMDMGGPLPFQFGGHDVTVAHIEADERHIAQGVERGMLDVGEHHALARSMKLKGEFRTELTGSADDEMHIAGHGAKMRGM